MSYNPLEAGGVEDYPVKVGSMLLTLVDPNQGFERAYNRWYERDHYYGGCLIGPHCLAGSRWVAPRSLKDLRWPRGETVAKPWDAGSYVAIYWVEAGHHDDHFAGWARPQVFHLYSNGRGFGERRHIHTVLFDHIGAVYRDDDPVPIELALDHHFDGLVSVLPLFQIRRFPGSISGTTVVWRVTAPNLLLDLKKRSRCRRIEPAHKGGSTL